MVLYESFKQGKLVRDDLPEASFCAYIRSILYCLLHEAFGKASSGLFLPFRFIEYFGLIPFLAILL